MRVSLRLSLLAPVCALALTACAASPGKSLFIPLQHYPLSIQVSIDGAPPTALLSSQALNLPNIGDSAVLTVLENGSHVSFSLSSASSCTNIVAISPATTAIQQTVTSTGGVSARQQSDLSTGAAPRLQLHHYRRPNPASDDL